MPEEYQEPFFPRCLARQNVGCDVDEVLWPDPVRRHDAVAEYIFVLYFYMGLLYTSGKRIRFLFVFTSATCKCTRFLFCFFVQVLNAQFFLFCNMHLAYSEQ